MKIFFDTSVLVATFYADHREHPASSRAFLAAGKDDYCAVRTLGEVYSALTGLPVRPRITGPEGLRIVNQIRERLSLISLSDQEYLSVIERTACDGIVGGATYDAFIARCALKAGATVLLTWNVRDFTRLGLDVSGIVKTPLEL